MADNTDAINDLNQSIASLNDTISSFSSSMQTQIKAMASYNQALGQNTTTVNQNNVANSGANRMAAAKKAAEEQLAVAQANFNKAIDSSAGSIRSFAIAMVSAEQGFKKYGQSITQAGDAVYNVGKSFGFLGGILGGAIKVITSFATAALGSIDILSDFRDEVSKTSGAIPSSLEHIQELGMQAGYSGERLAVLQKITAGLGTSLQGLGGVAGTGVLKFMQLADVTASVRDKFGKMGVNQEQLTDLQGKYVQIQAASGMQYQLQTKSMAQLRKESLEYADNMTRLSALTGKSADQLQKEKEQVEQEFEEQAATLADEAKIRELRKAGANEEADQLEKSMKARKGVMDNITTLLGPELSSQMQRVLRTGFFDAKSGPLARIMPELITYADRLKNLKPGDSADKVTRDIFNTVKKKYEEGAVDFRTVMQVLGEDGAKRLGYSAETFKRLASYGDKNYDQLVAQTETNKDVAEKQKGYADQIQKLRESEIEIQGQYNLAMTKLGGELMPLVTNTMNWLITNWDSTIKPALEKLGDWLKTGLSWLTEVDPKTHKTGFQKLQTAMSDLTDVVKWLYHHGKLLAEVVGGAYLAFKGYQVVNLTWQAMKGLWSLMTGFAGWIGKIIGAGGAAGGAGAAAAGGAGEAAGGLAAGEAAGGLAAAGETVGAVAGLEAAGVAADATGIGLPIGIALGLAGLGVAGYQYFKGSGDKKSGDQQLDQETKRTKETVVKTAETNSKASVTYEKNTKIQGDNTTYFGKIVAAFGTIVASEGKIIAAFSDMIKSFSDSVSTFSDTITTFTDTFGTSGSTVGATTGGIDPKTIQRATSFLTGKGWTPTQAAGIVGNLVTESRLKTDALGDNGKAYGIGQWHPDRQAKFKEVMHKDIHGSTLEDQLAFLDWELRHTEAKAGASLARTTTAAAAASIFDRKYERSSGAAIQERMANANAIASGNLSGITGIADQRIVALGNLLISQGFKVTENPSFGGVTPGVHKGKGHEEGRAIDINLIAGDDSSDPIAGPKMDALAEQLSKNPNFKVLWRKLGHFNHMHVETMQKAARGGVFSGPTGGYPIEMHGTEMVAPLNVDSILMKLAKTPVGTTETDSVLNSIIQPSGKSSTDIEKVVAVQSRMIDILGNKLDTVINVLETGNYTQNKILRHSLA